jgi:hypothetical protein
MSFKKVNEMIRKLTLLSFIAVSACAVPIPMTAPAPVPAPEPIVAPVANPQSAKERFVQAASLNGCEVNETNSSLILAGATLSVEDLARVMSELKAEGRGAVAPDGKSFRVTSGACA